MPSNVITSAAVNAGPLHLWLVTAGDYCSQIRVAKRVGGGLVEGWDLATRSPGPTTSTKGHQSPTEEMVETFSLSGQSISVRERERATELKEIWGFFSTPF